MNRACNGQLFVGGSLSGPAGKPVARGAGKGGLVAIGLKRHERECGLRRARVRRAPSWDAGPVRRRMRRRSRRLRRSSANQNS